MGFLRHQPQFHSECGGRTHYIHRNYDSDEPEGHADNQPLSFDGAELHNKFD